MQSLEALQNTERTYVCEADGCGRQVPESQTYSLAFVYRMPGPGVAAFQCPGEQHFACSHDHAVQSALACLKTHIEPVHQQLIQESKQRSQARQEQIDQIQQMLEASRTAQKEQANG